MPAAIRIWRWRCLKCGNEFDKDAATLPPRECLNTLAVEMGHLPRRCDGAEFLKIAEKQGMAV